MNKVLTHAVECNRGVYFETIAAFDCEPAARWYAQACAEVHPEYAYRAVALEDK
jgi:hypothetical protein